MGLIMVASAWGGYRMDNDQFWQIIEAARKKHPEDGELRVDAIRDHLSKLAPHEIIDFDTILDECRDRAYSWDLWGAIYLMNGGCSDDGFTDFRGWLISRGREVYERALGDPDSLADEFDPSEDDYELLSMLNVADEAYEASTGEAMPSRARTFPKLAGERWAAKDLHERYPRIGQLLSDFYADAPDPVEQLRQQAAPDQDLPDRLAAFFVLSQMEPKPEWAISVLEQALEDANPQIRSAANSTLKKIQGE